MAVVLGARGFKKEPEEMSKPFETSNSDEAVCPYCGCEHSDSWEFFAHHAHLGEAEVDCNNCGKTFLIEQDVTVTYTTRKK